MKTVKNILLVAICFALGFLSGCSRTIYGFCKDGETAFSMAGRAIRPLAEKQDEADAKKKEEDLHGQLTRAERDIIEANSRAERFANRNPMKKTTAEE